MSVMPATDMQDSLTETAQSKPLVVGYILKMFPRFSETFILNEILELESQGVKVVIFSMKEPVEDYTQPGVDRVQGRVLVIPPFQGSVYGRHLLSHCACLMRYPRGYLKTLRFARTRRAASAWNKFLTTPFVVREARAARVEHLHAHFASGPARQAKFASMMSGIPFSFTAHAKDLFWEGHKHGKNNKLKKRVRMASFVITISEYNRKFILRQGFKVPNGRLVTIYNGMNLGQWPMLRPEGQPVVGPEEDSPMILGVGRLVPKKGFHVLVQAAQILYDKELPFRCVIVGEGPERVRLKDLISRLGLKERVVLAGPVSQDRLLEDYYTRASLLAQPSVVSADGDQDGIPTVILEGLAVGLPVVATPISGISEAVMDGETGLLVQPGDPVALAEAIEKVLANPEQAGHFAAGGRKLIERRFNLQSNTKLLVHLMKVAARGEVRLTQGKLRRRVGLEPLEHIPPEGVVHNVHVEG